ncbi:MAG: hypothetical protein AVO34_12400 [Firmicutes bacterium ML8_F2]|jgi:hypothetical protein|nr:MAG: hypothetical protein AVO34_12400 [Firmicutes bacterium ML8_F2]
MIEIYFEVDGKKVSLDNFGDEFEKSMYAEVINSISNLLGSVSCPEHHQKPSVTFVKGDGSELSWKVGGCCQALIDAALNKFKEND